jgi:hypothetical protein
MMLMGSADNHRNLNRFAYHNKLSSHNMTTNGKNGKTVPLTLRRWMTSRLISSFALVRFESATHCIASPQLVRSAWVKSLSCLFMAIRYVTPLLSGLRLKKGPFVLLDSQAVYSESGVRYIASVHNVSRGGSITEGKNISGNI